MLKYLTAKDTLKITKHKCKELSQIAIYHRDQADKAEELFNWTPNWQAERQSTTAFKANGQQNGRSLTKQM